jgi:formylglycine-generating enzyme required for sulfatase activity
MGDVLGDGDQSMLPETPVHEVEVGSFDLAKHEVTVAEFRQFVEATGYKTSAETDGKVKATKEMLEQGKMKHPNWAQHWFKQADNHPVVWIAWEDAIVYCNWLSRRRGLPISYEVATGRLLDKHGRPTNDVRHARGLRLPTEAEWEYAAREGGKRLRFGNGKNIALSSEMNFDARKAKKAYTVQGEFRGVTTPVGSFAPNALGLYDMSGNAWEWCTDSGVEYEPTKRINPYVLSKDGWHVARGGNFEASAPGCRVTTRINWWRHAKCSATGFRIARTATSNVGD